MRTGESSTVQLVIAIAVALVCIVLVLFMYWGMEGAKDKLLTAKSDLAKAAGDLKKMESDAGKLATEACGQKSLVNALADMKVIQDDYKKTLPDLPSHNLKAILTAVAERNAALETESKNSQSALTEEKKQHARDMEDLNGKIKGTEERLGAVNKSSEEQIAVLQKGNKELVDNINAIKDANRVNYAKLQERMIEEQKRRIASEKEADGLREQLQALQGSKDKEPGRTDPAAYNPDGRVINIDGNLAVIDVGDADGVKPGMIFAVYYTEANSRILKSMGVVKEAGKDAHISLLRLYRPSENTTVLDGKISNLPVITGDNVAGLFFFRKGHKPVFFLDGTFTTTGPGGINMDIRDVQRKIMEYGGTIANEIMEDTDYVVLGANFDPKNLERARQLGKKIVTKSDIMEFLEANVP